MLPITKNTTFWIQAKLVPPHDPYRWPGLGGIVFYAGFQDTPYNPDYILPMLVWDRGQWCTHTETRDIDA